MATLTFYGGTETVTGSRFYVEIDNKKILVDCGLFQGTKENRLKNWETFPVSPRLIDYIILTHAHIDHSGYVPRICRDGFRGRILSTHATRDLSSVMLKDSARLQEEDAVWATQKGFSKHSPVLPLYTSTDVEEALKLFSPGHYGKIIPLTDNLRVKFKDAGHILGSSLVDLKVWKNQNARKIVFSGDLGRPDRVIFLDPVQVYDVDYLVIESTYGNRLHDDQNPTGQLERIICETFERGGVLVIPAFAVGRTQVLLYIIRELEEQGKIPSMPIYVDSPMALTATQVFNQHIGDYDLQARVEILKGIQIFKPKQWIACQTKEESMAINKVTKHAIIVSASGMATGGRILHHLKNRLPVDKNTVLLIGYQIEGTRGRALLDGQKEVKIHGQLVPVHAKVESISGFSGHADYNEILAYLMGFNRPPEKTFIVHGDPASSSELAAKIKNQFGWNVVLPKLGETFELDI
jgi:metallo-beta-lactamase family protein